MKVLLCLDFENDIVHPEGKVSGKGYADFNEKNQTLTTVKKVQEQFRAAKLPVIHIKVGFSPNYLEQPKHSPLMGKAHEFGAFKLNSWGTEFINEVAPIENELIITKHRIGAFHGTGLELTLRNIGATEVMLTGVATDMVVESTAREAHDRDFLVTIVQDCCIAANHDDHQRSLLNIQKLAKVIPSTELLL